MEIIDVFQKKQLEKVEKFGESLNKSKKLENIGKVGNIGKQLGNNKKNSWNSCKKLDTLWKTSSKQLENSWKAIGKQLNLDKRCTKVGKP